jgi:hypothetical protein
MLFPVSWAQPVFWNTLVITIPSGVVLTSSRTRSGLVPPFSRFTLEKAGKTGRSVGEILDQSAMRSGDEWEKGTRLIFRTYTGVHQSKAVLFILAGITTLFAVTRLSTGYTLISSLTIVSIFDKKSYLWYH